MWKEKLLGAVGRSRIAPPDELRATSCLSGMDRERLLALGADLRVAMGQSRRPW